MHMTNTDNPIDFPTLTHKLGDPRCKDADGKPIIIRHMRCMQESSDESFAKTSLPFEVSGDGGVTAAFKIHYGEQPMLEVYFAICKLGDTYNKDTGIAVVETLMKNGQGITIPYNKDITLQDHLFNVFTSCTYNKHSASAALEEKGAEVISKEKIDDALVRARIKYAAKFLLDKF